MKCNVAVPIGNSFANKNTTIRSKVATFFPGLQLSRSPRHHMAACKWWYYLRYSIFPQASLSSIKELN